MNPSIKSPICDIEMIQVILSIVTMFYNELDFFKISNKCEYPYVQSEYPY